MGGVTVPERVHAGLLADARCADGLLAHTLDVTDAEVLLGSLPREEPGRGPGSSPVLTQTLQQQRREWDQTVLASLGAADVQGHALGVDVLDGEADDLADTQASGIGGLQNQAVARMCDDAEESRDLIGAEDTGKGFGLLAIGQGDDHVRSLQGLGVKETQGTDTLVVKAPGSLLTQQVQLILPDLFGPQLFGGAAEVPGKLSYVRDVTGHRPVCIIAALEVLDKALA
jgi:hypothetical protein